MALHLTQNRDGFPHGWTDITRFDEVEDNTGIGLGVLRLSPGEFFETTTANETAWLLMAGKVRVEVFFLFGKEGHPIHAHDRG